MQLPYPLAASMIIGLALAASADADLIVQLQNPEQLGAPGSSVVYDGTLTNTGSSPLFLNSDTLTLNASPDFTPTDLFFVNVPPELAATGGAGDSFTGALFSIAISASAPLDEIASGSLEILGGSDPNALGTLTPSPVAFSLTVQSQVAAVPEPSSLGLMIVVLFGAVAAARKRRHSRFSNHDGRQCEPAAVGPLISAPAAR